MPSSDKKIILLIDDDEDDFLLLRDVFKEFYPDIEMQWLQGSEGALGHLALRARDLSVPRPRIILLDMNMHNLNGREVIAQIKNSPDWRRIPMIVFSNSMNSAEAAEMLGLGVNSFIRKPAGYKELCDFAQVFYRYWFQYSLL